MITPLSGNDALNHSGKVTALMQIAFPIDFGEAWTESQLRGALVLPGTHLYLAEIDNNLTGFALTRTVLDETELLLIAVAPELRGQCIGSQLVSAIVNHCQSHHIANIFLEMRENNEARHFYKRHHFAITGKRPGYYRGLNGQKFDALTFTRSISF
jgi:[ribosomal protein S18]-alanine N-acetyltransferase